MPLLDVDRIIVRKRLRKINDAKVKSLMTSITETGLLTPILVCSNQLVAGAHRLEAYKRLGYDKIIAQYNGNINEPDSMQLIEIDENLFRNELSPAERGEHVALRVEILARRKAKEIKPFKVEAYRKKKNTSRPLSDEVSHNLDVKSLSTGTAEAIKEVAEVLGTAPTHISAAIRDHAAVTDADLNQNELEELNATQYKRVAKVAKTQGAEAAKTELLEQLTKPSGESVIGHDSDEKLKQDIGVIISARSVIRKLSKNDTELGREYAKDADEAMSSYIDFLRLK